MNLISCISQDIDNRWIFVVASSVLSLGLLMLYRSSWILWVNRFFREQIFSDRHILLERKKKAVLLILISVIFFSWWVYRSHYNVNLLSEQIVSEESLLYASLSQIYKRRYSAAFALSQRAVSRHPNSSEALSQLAVIYFLMGKHDQGKLFWKKARELDPDITPVKHLIHIIEADCNDTNKKAEILHYLNTSKN